MSIVIDLSAPSAIKAILLRSAAVVADESGNFRHMRYRAPNGRRFNVLHDVTGYYLLESVPNGLRREDASNGSPSFVIDKRIKQILSEKDPNGFLASLREKGVADQDVVRTYHQLSREMAHRYDALDDLDEAVGAIKEALELNEWIRPNDLAHEMQADSVQQRFRQRLVELEERSWKESPRMFRGLFNTVGPLPAQQREQIQAYLKDPTLENWKEISDISVKGNVSLWRAITLVDADAPIMDGSNSWCPLPPPDDLEAYLRQIGDADAMTMLFPDSAPDRELQHDQDDDPEHEGDFRPGF